jgi:hypothetical protein
MRVAQAKRAIGWALLVISCVALVLFGCGFVAALQSPSPAPGPPSTPWFVFESGFENGLAGWTGQNKRGADFVIISDPTGSGMGKVMKAFIVNPPPPLLPEDFPYITRRAYPNIWFSLKPLPCSMQEDVWVSRELYEQVMRRGNWYSLLSFFDSDPRRDRKGHVAVTTGLGDDGVLYLNIKDEKGDSFDFPPPLPNAPRLTPQEWHTVKIVVGADGRITLSQDNLEVSVGQLHPMTRRGLVGGHGGLYVGHDIRSSDPDYTGGFILTDNFRIACWR